MRYGFCLAKSTGFTPNYGYVRDSFTDENSWKHERNIQDNEILFWVDGIKFSKEQAHHIAEEKAQELFGAEPSWLGNVVDEIMGKS